MGYSFSDSVLNLSPILSSVIVLFNRKKKAPVHNHVSLFLVQVNSTALHKASSNGHDAVVRVLLAAKATVNTQNKVRFIVQPHNICPIVNLFLISCYTINIITCTHFV